MEFNRRQLLQFFGIGATITPVVGGAPMIEAAAKLLAVPSVQPVLAAPFPNGHTPEHFQDRLKWNPYEAIWLYFWQIENNPPWCVNGGVGHWTSNMREARADMKTYGWTTKRYYHGTRDFCPECSAKREREVKLG